MNVGLWAEIRRMAEIEKGVTRRPLPWTSLFDKDLEQKVVTKRASLMQNSG